MKPRLLDLYCGAGGCTKGYQRAGFHVTGVDVESMPRYCGDNFIQSDAIEYVTKHGHEYDVIHASPPCQGYSISKNNGCHKDAPLLIDDTRNAIKQFGGIFVIENVEHAPLENLPILGCHVINLCGASFSLRTGIFDLARHRLFESNVRITSLPCNHKRGFTIGVYGNGTNKYHRQKFGRCVRTSECREAMGIDWMNRKELTQAIPPAYTEFIGKQLINALN